MDFVVDKNIYSIYFEAGRREQTQGIEQVNQAITLMDRVRPHVVHRASPANLFIHLWSMTRKAV
jgi:hypothetical protein